jgi:hypothetical protein
MSISPSGKYIAILRNEKDCNEKKQYLEIWDCDCLLHCVKLSGSKKHGIVFDDATFGVLEWSPNEDHLLFIAERHRPKAVSYFDKDYKSSENGDSVRVCCSCHCHCCCCFVCCCCFCVLLLAAMVDVECQK